MDLIQKVSEYDQEIPQSHTADQLTHGIGKKERQNTNRKTIKAKQPVKMIAKLEKDNK